MGMADLTIETFNAGIESAAAEVAGGAKVVVYFYGDLTADGISWCGDCADADALIRGEATAAGVKLLAVAVGDRRSWKKDEANFFRTHSKFPVSSIPTLMKVTADGGDGGRLVEEECKDAEKVKAFYA